MTKRIHYFQHVPFENLGAIELWAQRCGHALSATRFFDGQLPPDIEQMDWLIVMGGPMGVHDDHIYPWLPDEKKAISRAVTAGKVVLGICLGAQLIAHALGARVTPNAHKEIGWYPIQLAPQFAGHPMVQDFPLTWDTFHWHGDTFAVPDSALPIASSDACRNQGFVYDGKVVGLQFHLEVTRAGVGELVRQCARDIRPDRFVQSRSELLTDQAPYAQNHALLEKLLNYLDTLS